MPRFSLRKKRTSHSSTVVVDTLPNFFRNGRSFEEFHQLETKRKSGTGGLPGDKNTIRNNGRAVLKDSVRHLCFHTGIAHGVLVLQQAKGGKKGRGGADGGHIFAFAVDLLNQLGHPGIAAQSVYAAQAAG